MGLMQLQINKIFIWCAVWVKRIMKLHSDLLLRLHNSEFCNIPQGLFYATANAWQAQESENPAICFGFVLNFHGKRSEDNSGWQEWSLDEIAYNLFTIWFYSACKQQYWSEMFKDHTIRNVGSILPFLYMARLTWRFLSISLLVSKSSSSSPKGLIICSATCRKRKIKISSAF